MDKQLLESTVSKVLDEMRLRPIPLGVSNRHIHLSAADYERLFPGHPISEKKALLQPGQYAAEQTVTLVGPKGQLKNVRLLGPLRSVSQVEISRTDARTLGVAAPLRMSGNLKDTPGIRLRTLSFDAARNALQLEISAVSSQALEQFSQRARARFRVQTGEMKPRADGIEGRLTLEGNDA